MDRYSDGYRQSSNGGLGPVSWVYGVSQLSLELILSFCCSRVFQALLFAMVTDSSNKIYKDLFMLGLTNSIS